MTQTQCLRTAKYAWCLDQFSRVGRSLKGERVWRGMRSWIAKESTKVAGLGPRVISVVASVWCGGCVWAASAIMTWARRGVLVCVLTIRVAPTAEGGVCGGMHGSAKRGLMQGLVSGPGLSVRRHGPPLPPLVCCTDELRVCCC